MARIRPAVPGALEAMTEVPGSSPGPATAADDLVTETPPGSTAPRPDDPDGVELLRSIPWRFISYLFPQLYVMGLSIAAARFLGPYQMGQQSYMAFIGITVVALAQGGVPTAVTRFLSESLGAGHHERARKVQRWGAWAIAVNALIGLVIVGVTAALSTTFHLGWALLCVSTVLAVLNGLPLAVLAALHRWRLTALVYLLNDTVTLALTLGALALGYGISGMFAVETLGVIAPLAIFTVVARRGLAAAAPRTDRPVEAGLRRRLLRFSWIGTLQTLVAYVVFRRTELLFLRHFSTNQEIALYSIAFAASSALQQLPATLQSVMLPTYSSLVGAGRVQELREAVSRSVRLMAVLCLPLAAVGAAVIPRAISVLYGAQYAAAGDVLLILMPLVAVVPVVGVGAPLLGAMELQRWPLIYTVIGCGVDIALAAALVPPLGARGAAMAGLGAQLTATVPLAFYASRRVGGIDLQPRRLAASVISAAAGGAAAYGGVTALPGAAGLVTGILLGVVGYLVAGRVTRVLSPEDAGWLRAGAGKRASALVGLTARWLGGTA